MRTRHSHKRMTSEPVNQWGSAAPRAWTNEDTQSITSGHASSSIFLQLFPRVRGFFINGDSWEIRKINGRRQFYFFVYPWEILAGWHLHCRKTAKLVLLVLARSHIPLHSLKTEINSYLWGGGRVHPSERFAGEGGGILTFPPNIAHLVLGAGYSKKLV
jgi:hypothetical protein